MRRLIALTLLLTTGCFQYVPAARPELATGTPVRVRLAEPIPVRLATVTVNNARELRGEVVGPRADSLAISVFNVLSMEGTDYLAAGATVSVPLRSIAVLEERRLSNWRTLGLVGVVVALIASVSAAASEGGGGGTRPPGGGNPR